ncbi:MAG: ParB/RepB/Spo0J family partition protein, partial [Thermaurantiacus tibetensis]
MGTAPPLATATGTVAIDLIDPNPRQPRQDFDEARLEELAQSIRERGILQPLLLRPRGSRYEIVAGERRCRISATSYNAVSRSCGSENSCSIPASTISITSTSTWR